MKYLIPAMIYAGSALMVYNIIRYGMFVKRNADLDKESSKRGVTIVPMVLLVFFLIGYVVVGVSGIADLMVAAILFFGSVFVFLLLWVMFSIIDHIRDTEKALAARYDEVVRRVRAMDTDSVEAIRVNLTRDEVEAHRGEYLYCEEKEYDSYSDFMKAWSDNILYPESAGTVRERFSRDGLIRCFEEGKLNVSEVVLIRRRDGVAGFVKLDATLTIRPVSGDVMAFVVEHPYDEEIVRKTLLEKVMMDSYDRVAFIIDGNYKDFITNTGKKKGLLLNINEEDTYESIYLNYFLPAIDYDPVSNGGAPNPLRLSVIEKALAENESYDVDAPFVIDGERHYKHFIFYKIDGKAKFYLMILSDSTRAREEQDARSRALSDALAEAVRANEARVRFFTGISHGLRTPMNGIVGFSELAMREKDAGKLREYASKIDLSGKRLLLVVNDLFAMSLIESGRLTFEKEPVDLPALAEKIAGDVSALHPEKNAKIVVDTTAVAGEKVISDPGRLSQLLERLVENALLFAHDGTEVKLSVTKDGAERVFRVASKCDAMPPDVVDRVFESDIWDANDEASVLPGAGIGMAVAKKLIEGMNGKVSVNSDAGGTVFTVVLPLALADSEIGGGSTGGFCPLCLLVVDDNEINREIAQLMLGSEGHKIDLAFDGADAVEKVKASGGKYDAVLMDVQMPVMNGYEATSSIRALPDKKLAAIPIIAMTANAYQEDKNEALEAGMDGYVPKPIDPDTVRAALAKALSK